MRHSQGNGGRFCFCKHCLCNQKCNWKNLHGGYLLGCVLLLVFQKQTRVSGLSANTKFLPVNTLKGRHQDFSSFLQEVFILSIYFLLSPPLDLCHNIAILQLVKTNHKPFINIAKRGMSNTYEQRYIFFFQLQIYGLQTENKAGRDSMALGKFTSLLDDSALEHSIQDLSVWRKSIVENHTFL